MPQADSKREEFHKYLEKSRILDQISRALIKLYDEKKATRPTTPETSTPHIMKLLGGVSFEEHEEAKEILVQKQAELLALEPPEEDEGSELND